MLNDEELEGTPDTIIVGDNARPTVTDRYHYSRTTWVEDPHFVDRCIKKGAYAHDQIIFKNMTGTMPGGKCVYLLLKRHSLSDILISRAHFTDVEDIRLASYIAQLIPDKKSGGRTGNNIYKILCSNVRHSQSSVTGQANVLQV